MISLDQFLSTIFADVKEGVVVLADVRPDPSGRAIFPARQWRPGRSRIQGATYYCISTARPQPDGKIRRTLSDMLWTHVIVLDDIGTKIPLDKFRDRAGPLYILETSPGNFQWGYKIVPSDPDKAAALIHALALAGYTDVGAQGKNRVVRVPGSVNTKRERFVATLREWHPEDPPWTLEELAAEFGVTPQADAGGNSVDRPNYVGASTKDPVYNWLQERGHVLGPPNQDGYASIVCPWAAEHTDPRQDARWAVGAGLTGAFKCFHAACQERGTAEFLDWVSEAGGPDFAAIEAAEVSAVGAKLLAKVGGRGRSGRRGERRPKISTAAPEIRPPDGGEAQAAMTDPPRPPPDTAALLARVLDRLPWLQRADLPTVERSAGGGIKAEQKPTVENIGWIAEACEFRIARNELSGEIEIDFDDPELNLFLDPLDRLRLTRELLTSQCQRLGISARATLQPALDALASGNRYHPLVDWVNEKAWDGRDRIGQLAMTLNTPDTEWCAIAVTRWCVQAAVAWTNWRRQPPISVPHVFVLCGPQGCGKTSWFRSLLPDGLVQTEAALHLDSNRADEHKRKVLSSPIVELGELETTLSRSENGAMRAFLSNTTDRYRLPYDRDVTVRTRGTIFGASVNDPEFLLDPWGARRFWTVAVKSCDWRHGIDLQQLWAQAFALMAQGVPWNLTGDKEHAMHAVVSDRHRVISYAESLLQELETRRQTIPDDEWPHVTAAEVAGYYKLERHAATWKIVGRVLREMFGEPQRSAGKLGWRVPIRRHEFVSGFVAYSPGAPKLKVVK